MDILIREAATAFNSAAGRIFIQECGIEEYVDSADFCVELIRLFTKGLPSAKYLMKRHREKLAATCRSWGQSFVEVFWSKDFNPYVIRANRSNEALSIGAIMTQPIIATPSIEVGSLTLSRSVLRRLEYLIENPNTKGALVRVHDEAQVAMSQASASLIIGASTKEAVQRKRSEYWHPQDLVRSRRQISDFVHDLSQGIIKPEDTRHELSWRGVSKDGRNWRQFTHIYETFIDELGVAYQFATNIGVEQIEPPSDLVLI
ncbi:MAG TPA: hypothetical protein V6D33_09050 [Cyanophyceae cyanobacterium]